ncbi:DNA repair protein RAD51 [Carpediemonas membranifera]|uniref:DNA repair protein RAD51 homolog 3 n=1 Tax=Carpediemonas membranifera TaxID=201153 RepID=A0A8J6DXM9_9EUKA|nr:DNA repair protein RAD51 [Carpediemonas membranifera]|eukprot:KAG9390549.1 DNA repair protein RAD51 [Carpediemonas membranifera]
MSDKRPINALGLPESTVLRLNEANLRNIADLSALGSVAALAKRSNLNLSESTAVFVAIETLNAPTISTAALGTPCSVFFDPTTGPQLITFIRGLDEKFGLGLPTGELVHVCGIPGTGKTQLTMQLCLTVQIPKPMGGLDGSAIFIDTEGSFSAARLHTMARSLREHLSARVQRVREAGGGPQSDAMGRAVSCMDPDGMLGRVKLMRVLDVSELLACVQMLPGILSVATDTRLIVIDSLAMHFRHTQFDSARDRAQLMAELCDSLSIIAYRFKLLIVITNHTTTKYTRVGRQAYLGPALGDAVFLAPVANLMLGRDSRGEGRTIRVQSRHLIDRRPVPICVGAEGVRDGLA